MEVWAKPLEIDMILNKNQLLWTSSSYDATQKFIEVLKEQDLYEEFNQEEFLEIQ